MIPSQESRRHAAPIPESCCMGCAQQSRGGRDAPVCPEGRTPAPVGWWADRSSSCGLSCIPLGKIKPRKSSKTPNSFNTSMQGKPLNKLNCFVNFHLEDSSVFSPILSQYKVSCKNSIWVFERFAMYLLLISYKRLYEVELPKLMILIPQVSYIIISHTRHLWPCKCKHMSRT